MGTIGRVEWIQGVEQVRGWAAMCGVDERSAKVSMRVLASWPVAVVGRTASFWAWKLSGGA